MQIIKNINNNYALAIDDAGNKLIVSGKGIGFGNIPRVIEDLSRIDRSYYDVDEAYISMINDIPEEIIKIASRITDKARATIDDPIGSNIVFTLADHINFSIQRYKKKMDIKLPIFYDIQYFFKKEMMVGEYGLRLIGKELDVYLPKEEAACIALHIINAEEREKNRDADRNEEIIDKVRGIIEEEYDIEINKDSFNYSRFVSHMHYLLKRRETKHLIHSDNNAIYERLKEEHQKTYECEKKVSEYLNSILKIKLSDEEKLYLMLHINRLCTRENSD